MNAIAGLILFASSLFGPPRPEQTHTRVLSVDIVMDSGEEPLGAYQVEFTVAREGSKPPRVIVVEGGETAAFASSPRYDAKAVRGGRLILAGFSLEAEENLPKGRTRVARVHLRVEGPGPQPTATARAMVAGNGRAERIEASAEATLAADVTGTIGRADHDGWGKARIDRPR